MSTVPLPITDRVRLNDDREIPTIGFGTYRLTGEAGHRAMVDAIDAGYRHVDTATFYNNETEVGRAIRDSGVPRKNFWITTKLWNTDHDRPRHALEQSLSRLGTDYVDLWLIHWPVKERLDSWKMMERAQDEGLARSIGVSNFLMPHLKELLAVANVVPAVNQIELSPFLYGTRAGDIAACSEAGIAVQAYSPVTRGTRLDDPVLTGIANEVNATPAQVLLRWCIQHEFIPLPRSSNRERVRENLNLGGFRLSEKQMNTLDTLDQGLTVSWDPTTTL